MKKPRLWPKKNLCLFAVVFCFFQSVCAIADEQIGIVIDKDDRCPVCAMKVALYPKFACSMELVDGRRLSFCASGCMIRSWLYPEIQLGVDKSSIKHVWVQDYFTGQRIDGVSAYWVAGSDVIGPMGPAIVPLKSEHDVTVFTRRHGGKTIFHLMDLTDEKWKDITGKK